MIDKTKRCYQPNNQIGNGHEVIDPDQHYGVNLSCSNCKNSGWMWVPLGVTIEEALCWNCGCNSLDRG